MKRQVTATQEQRILAHLRRRGAEGVSGVEAEDLFRVRDLPKRISVLRQQGYNIRRELRTDELGQRYARYYLQEV